MARFKIYDEDDNFLGEYVGEFVEDAKDSVANSFAESTGAGLLSLVVLLVIKFPWLILVIIAWLLLKAVWGIIKLVVILLWRTLQFAAPYLWIAIVAVFRSFWWLLGLVCLSVCLYGGSLGCHLRGYFIKNSLIGGSRYGDYIDRNCKILKRVYRF